VNVEIITSWGVSRLVISRFRGREVREVMWW
jgi:hypothetical protein